MRFYAAHFLAGNSQISRSLLLTLVTSCRRAAAKICPAQACKWWHDIRHVCIWKGDHYCMSMLACQYNQPKRPGDLDLLPFDLDSGVWVTCDVGYLCANFGLPRPLCSRLRPDVRDRQTSDVRQHHRLMPPGRGHNKFCIPGSKYLSDVSDTVICNADIVRDFFTSWCGLLDGRGILNADISDLISAISVCWCVRF